MKDKPDSDLTRQLQESRELLEQGRVEEALVLAMDLLRRELGQLQDALRGIQENLPASPEGGPPAFLEEISPAELFWPEPISRLLH